MTIVYQMQCKVILHFTVIFVQRLFMPPFIKNGVVENKRHIQCLYVSIRGNVNTEMRMSVSSEHLAAFYWWTSAEEANKARPLHLRAGNVNVNGHTLSTYLLDWIIKPKKGCGAGLFSKVSVIITQIPPKKVVWPETITLLWSVYLCFLLISLWDGHTTTHPKANYRLWAKSIQQ